MDEKCVTMAERLSAMETKIADMQTENKIFRDEVRKEIREVRRQNEAIYEIASSVQIIAQDVGNIKQDISDVKAGQKELGEKMDSEIESVKGSNSNRIDLLAAKIDEIINESYDFGIGYAQMGSSTEHVLDSKHFYRELVFNTDSLNSRRDGAKQWT